MIKRSRFPPPGMSLMVKVVFEFDLVVADDAAFGSAGHSSEQRETCVLDLQSSAQSLGASFAKIGRLCMQGLAWLLHFRLCCVLSTLLPFRGGALAPLGDWLD
jgi:hypothetical protein